MLKRISQFEVGQVVTHISTGLSCKIISKYVNGFVTVYELIDDERNTFKIGPTVLNRDFT